MISMGAARRTQARRLFSDACGRAGRAGRKCRGRRGEAHRQGDAPGPPVRRLPQDLRRGVRRPLRRLPHAAQLELVGGDHLVAVGVEAVGEVVREGLERAELVLRRHLQQVLARGAAEAMA